jgi:hypothetical protein
MEKRRECELPRVNMDAGALARAVCFENKTVDVERYARSAAEGGRIHASY